MKKYFNVQTILRSTIMALLIITLCLFVFSIYAASNNYYTQNNNASTTTYVMTCKNNPVLAHIINQDLTEEELEKDAEIELTYQTAHKLREPTYNYNCHSYAWYSQDENNNIWIDFPNAFLEDGTYPQTVWAVGDRIVYYNVFGVPTHSGIITNITGNTISQITVTSKWGPYGLYEHQGDDCSYTLGAYTFEVFRLCVHEESTHSYNTVSVLSHTYSCPICGVLKAEPHTLNALNRCTKCGGKGTHIEINSTNLEMTVQ